MGARLPLALHADGKELSMTIDIGGVEAKLERARTHMAELQRAAAAFHASAPYELDFCGAAPNTDSPYNLVVTRADPVPDSLAAITGDVIHNLRAGPRPIRSCRGREPGSEYLLSNSQEEGS